LIRRAYLLLNEEYLLSALAALQAVKRTPADLALSNNLQARLQREFNPRPMKHKPIVLPDIDEAQDITASYPKLTDQSDI
jgi:hypothetical protein